MKKGHDFIALFTCDCRDVAYCFAQDTTEIESLADTLEEPDRVRLRVYYRRRLLWDGSAYDFGHKEGAWMWCQGEGELLDRPLPNHSPLVGV